MLVLRFPHFAIWILQIKIPCNIKYLQKPTFCIKILNSTGASDLLKGSQFVGQDWQSPSFLVLQGRGAWWVLCQQEGSVFLWGSGSKVVWQPMIATGCFGGHMQGQPSQWPSEYSFDAPCLQEHLEQAGSRKAEAAIRWHAKEAFHWAMDWFPFLGKERQQITKRDTRDVIFV